MSQRDKPLKVCFPSGERVIAKITPVPGGKIVVAVPEFSIKFSVERLKYKEALKRLEKYLEDLILKGMADENFDTGSGADFDPGRAPEESTGGQVERPKRPRRPTGVHAGPRGNKSTESVGSGPGIDEMAEGSDPPISGENQNGD